MKSLLQKSMRRLPEMIHLSAVIAGLLLLTWPSL